jgi:hypothetical protein
VIRHKNEAMDGDADLAATSRLAFVAKVGKDREIQ